MVSSDKDIHFYKDLKFDIPVIIIVIGGITIYCYSTEIENFLVTSGLYGKYVDFMDLMKGRPDPQPLEGQHQPMIRI